MPKLIFRAEVRLPRMIILPLPVAREAESPRTITLNEREMEVAAPVADHLRAKYPRWFDQQTDAEPAVIDYESMTVKQLKQHAADNNIDLEGAERKPDIITAIRNAKPLSAEAMPEDDADLVELAESDVPDGEPLDTEAAPEDDADWDEEADG